MPQATSKSKAPLNLASLKTIQSFSGKTVSLPASASSKSKTKPQVKIVTKVKAVSPLSTAQRQRLMSAMRTIASLGGYSVTRVKGRRALI